MKIRLVGAEFFHVDGETDMKKQIVACRTFAEAPKNKPWTKVFWQGFIRAFLTGMVNVFHNPNFFVFKPELFRNWLYPLSGDRID